MDPSELEICEGAEAGPGHSMQEPKSPVASKKRPKYGQLVWAKVPGLRWWPGQVITREHALLFSSAKDPGPSDDPDAVLVSFFGDFKHAYVRVSNLRDIDDDEAHQFREQQTKATQEHVSAEMLQLAWHCCEYTKHTIQRYGLCRCFVNKCQRMPINRTRVS